jgi:general secretion pathway protein M
MKDWWQGLAAREQRTLALGALLALLLLGYALLWLPLERSRAEWRTRAAAADVSLSWMRDAAQRLRAAGPAQAAAQRDGRSLLAVVDAGVREAGLGGALLRVEPVSAGQVRVYFQQASFDALMDWLYQLDTSHGIRVTELSVQRSAGVGLVDARLALDAPIQQ